jgi:hypothetical protein
LCLVTPSCLLPFPLSTSSCPFWTFQQSKGMRRSRGFDPCFIPGFENSSRISVWHSNLNCSANSYKDVVRWTENKKTMKNSNKNQSLSWWQSQMQIPQFAFHSMFLPLTASGTIWTTCPPQPGSSSGTATVSSMQRRVPAWQTNNANSSETATTSGTDKRWVSKICTQQPASPF